MNLSSNHPTESSLPLSTRVNALQASKIREVAEIGMTMDDVIPLWFGEGVWPTAQCIVDSAVKSLQDGLHHYQPNNGHANLREAVAEYSSEQLKASVSADRVTITPSGMQGLMLSAQLLVSPGDHVVVIEPGWPNITECYKAMGATIHPIALQPKNGKWSLDIDELLSTITKTAATVVVINSPNNPTGWTLSTAEQTTILNHCRALGTWIVADDVYSRLYRHASHAPSFLSLAESNDRLVSVNSFSKSWSMTGWRLGWMVTPKQCVSVLGQLTEFNTSCTNGFVQQAGVTALRQGEGEIATLKERIDAGYRVTSNALSNLPKVDFIEPDGAFYAFFKVRGMTDSHSAAIEILENTRVGLAPGVAFGTAGEGYLRICYAQPVEVLSAAFERLESFLS